MRPTTLVVGIDEAGYGPLLGPLVVSAAVVEIAPPLDGDGLWDALEAVVCRSPDRSGDRIVVGDSKRLYRGRRDRGGVARLERGVLAALAAAGRAPGSFDDLLAQVSPGLAHDTELAPWYRPAGRALPERADAEAVRVLGAGLREHAARVGVTFVGLHSEVLFEPRFNARVAALGNKSDVLFEAVTAVLRRAWRDPAPRRVAVIDRQGGRAHYRALLEAAFPEAFVWTREECATRSAYRVMGDGWEAEVRFDVAADAHTLPVALAAMTSKYVRELFMAQLNAYWGRVVPGLAPTSGYWTDGGRFLAAIAPALEAGGIPVGALRRLR